MAFYTKLAGTGFAVYNFLMKMMPYGVIVCGAVALQAEGIILIGILIGFQRMNIVAITATDPALIHLTLHKRAIHIIFFFYLAIWIVQCFSE